MTDTATHAMPPAVLATLDQASAEARNLGEAVARMWTTYQEAGMPEDLCRALVVTYHRAALGAPVDPVTGPVIIHGCDGGESCPAYGLGEE